MNDEHLGDGAYVSFDGHQFWLAANHHENKVVALEPQVLLAFFAYVLRTCPPESVMLQKMVNMFNTRRESCRDMGAGTYGDCDPNAPFDSSKPYGGNGSVPF